MIAKKDFEQAKAFIYADIEREIALGKATRSKLRNFFLRIAGIPSGGGNFMAALALLSYTEFAGRLKNQDFSAGNSETYFNDFFALLGPHYRAFLNQHPEVYNTFRCGLAHEYYVKKDCEIAMEGIDLPYRHGLNYDNGKYFFIVKKYFEDFKSAFSTLGNKMYP